jgi:hypothetical protein
MTMYLSNTDLHPTGSETAEFMDIPPMAEHVATAQASKARRDGTMRLDVQTRLNIARWAREYIAGLVENHHGGPEDVRSIIHDLHDRRAIAGPDGSP